jgi:hypothetical protein
VTGILFAAMFFALMLLFGALPAFVVSFVAAFCLFFFILNKRAIRIVCPYCAKYIETNTSWICGNKGCRNDRIDDFPFIYRCEHCGSYPKAYECHHCGELIFFSEDQQRTGFARCASAPATSEPVKDEHEIEIAKKKKVVQLSQLDLEKAKLDVELKGYKQTLEPQKPRGVRERLRSKVGSKTELDDEVRRLKTEADEEFLNDPVGREKRHRIIDDEARNLL